MGLIRLLQPGPLRGSIPGYLGPEKGGFTSVCSSRLKILQPGASSPPCMTQPPSLPSRLHSSGPLYHPLNLSLLPPPGLVPEPQSQVAEEGALWEDPGGAEPLHVCL